MKPSFILSVKGDPTMSRLIKILHIDPDYQVPYLIYRPRSVARTSVPLQTAIKLLKTQDFDLIISEPHNKAILKKEHPFSKPKPLWSEDQPVAEDIHGDLRQVRPISYS